MCVRELGHGDSFQVDNSTRDVLITCHACFGYFYSFHGRDKTSHATIAWTFYFEMALGHFLFAGPKLGSPVCQVPVNGTTK